MPRFGSVCEDKVCRVPKLTSFSTTAWIRSWLTSSAMSRGVAAEAAVAKRRAGGGGKGGGGGGGGPGEPRDGRQLLQAPPLSPRRHRLASRETIPPLPPP